jgi:hypothetical protein
LAAKRRRSAPLLNLIELAIQAYSACSNCCSRHKSSMSQFLTAATGTACLFSLSLLASPEATPQSTGLEPQRAALIQVGQTLSRVVVKAKKVNEQLGYGFQEGGCVFGVKLRPGTSARESFSLQAGQSYVFIGGGDKTARNVDIVLRDAKGRVVSQDTEADAAPFILFKPKSTGRYTMSLVLKSGWKGPAFCAVTVLRKGGASIPLGRIIEAAIRMDFASLDAFREAGGGRINEAQGTWALYGGVLRPGQSFSNPPKRFKATRRGVVAVGDSRVRDLDLTLLDGAGKVIVRNTTNGASPKIDRQIGAGMGAVRVSNRSSAGPALVMAVLLDFPEPPKVVVPTPASTPVPTPTAFPVAQAEQDSPFEGDWKGDWSDEKKGRAGSFKMRVKSDGSVNGHLSVPALKAAGKFKGTFTPDGAFRLNYTQSKRESLVEGTLKFADDEHDKIQGQASFSTGNTVFGTAEFTLEKQD